MLSKKHKFITGEHPVANLDGKSFNTHIGVPLGFGTQDKRDYGVFLLMSSTNRDFNCELCMYLLIPSGKSNQQGHGSFVPPSGTRSHTRGKA